ncbi:MAG: T9SS type A sorting domain-containing protein [Bacteroidetes bacterium]|nr:T9SS type A sorting domain-containing protein [Bacteroidota bacterium]
MRTVQSLFTLRRKFIFSCFACVVFCGTASLRAQNMVSFGVSGFSGMPDTVYSSNNAVLVGAFLKNTSVTFSYNDTIQVDGYIDRGASTVPLHFPPVDSININPGDSLFFIIPVQFADTFMQGLFRIGGNVIVVWPTVFNSVFATGDSLTATVFVLDSVNSTGAPLHNFDEVRCYPVPATGMLYITGGGQQLHPKEVVISDATGKIIVRSKDVSMGINTEPWPPGIYFLDVLFDNDTHHVYKISRE